MTNYKVKILLKIIKAKNYIFYSYRVKVFLMDSYLLTNDSNHNNVEN